MKNNEVTRLPFLDETYIDVDRLLEKVSQVDK